MFVMVLNVPLRNVFKSKLFEVDSENAPNIFLHELI